MKLVNLGCGHRYHPDFVNVDIVATGPGVLVHDLSRGVPLETGTADVVYSAATLEHLRPADAERFVGECFRVLKPGGLLRLGVPDTERLCRLYLEKLELAAQGDAEAAHDYDWLRLEAFDQATRENPGGAMIEYLAQSPLPGRDFILERIGEEGRDLIEPSSAPAPRRPLTPGRVARFVARTAKARLLRLLLGRGGYHAYQVGAFRLGGEAHQQAYDRFSLGRLLVSAGFQDPKVCDAFQSAVPSWADYHLDVTAEGRVMKPDLFFMEAVKPA